MKYLFLIIIVLVCTYIGYGLSSYYSKRVNFFKNVSLLFEKMKLEINFSQLKLMSILQNFNSSSKEASVLITNFQQALENNTGFTNDVLFKNIKIINEDEQNSLTIFFASLGKFDVFNQNKQLESQGMEILEMKKNSEEQAKKYGPLYIKIGVIVGLLVALILL